MIYVGTAAQMRDAENKLFSQGITPIEMMGSVGRLLSEELCAFDNILFVCGKGNNAGDGYAAAYFLQNENKAVTILRCHDELSDAGRYYFEKLRVKCICRYKNIDFSSYDVIVDCLYGIGFHGEMSDEDKTLIASMNSSGKPIFSVDIPSGLDADNGTTNCSVVADKVYTVGFAKYGLYLNSGKDYVKYYTVFPLGLDTSETGILIEPEDCTEFVMPRKNDSHKGTFGYTALFGGCKFFSGAIRLANLAASSLRSGTGVLRLAVPEEIFSYIAPHLLESTLFSENDYEKVLFNAAAVGIGCGWGRTDDRTVLLNNILRYVSCPVILDADGLYAWKALGCPPIKDLIVTPHYAEMAHLADKTVEEVRLSPVSSAVGFALSKGCIVLLKGPSTVITDGKTILITNRGSAGMATAGSGDILLGILTSIIGQRFENTLKSVAYATIINGIAGEFAERENTDISMTASDTVKKIGDAVMFLRKCCLKN